MRKLQLVQRDARAPRGLLDVHLRCSSHEAILNKRLNAIITTSPGFSAGTMVDVDHSEALSSTYRQQAWSRSW